MIPAFLLQKEQIEINTKTRSKNLSFIDKTIKKAANFVTSTFTQWQSARKEGLFQLLDNRVKVLFLLIGVIGISFCTYIITQLAISGVIFLIYILSKLDILQIYKRILIIGFIFGFIIFLPACLNLFTKGDNAFTLIRFSKPHTFWIYTIPQEITITWQGIDLVIRLTLKIINSVSIVLLVISTTTFEQIIKSLAFLRVPKIFLLTLTLTYKFIFILSNSIIESYYAIKMRWWNRGSVKEAENVVTGRVGYLFRKSRERYELVYQSMIARGFTGKFDFGKFQKLHMKDYLFIATCISFAGAIFIINYYYARTI
ncbi:MAG: cobalt ECF transporter T component CbiQ [Bacteroidales bacterium]|nr:cobalt ECF transporter T component CbiQ [Bacteroidales bacterium]